MSGRIRALYAELPLSFERNQGQTDSSVAFLSRGAGHTLFLTRGEAVLRLGAAQAFPAGSGARAPSQASPAVAADLRLRLEGANRQPEIVGLDELPGRSNYYLGNDPSRWHTGIVSYAKVAYREVYPGIDLVFYGNQRQLEYDFILAPGADPALIRLEVEGAEALRVDEKGNLLIDGGGRVIQHAPVVYQERQGSRRVIAGNYRVESGDRVAFDVGSYDRTEPLFIDPILSYSTFFGGAESDQAYGLAVDSSGNAYITGSTFSTDLPRKDPFQSTFGGGDFLGGDAYVAKLSPGGASLVYSTYLGGQQIDFARGIAVDSAGSAYVVGETSTKLSVSASTNDFPVTSNAFNKTHSGFDGFVAKLSATGTLVYSSYMGGPFTDTLRSVAVDASGNAYVAGDTNSENLATPGAFQRIHDRGPSLTSLDAFVAKINPSGSALVYLTLLGGAGEETSQGIAVDASGNVLLAGNTNSSRFPTMNPLQAAKGGVFRSSDGAGTWTQANTGLDLLNMVEVVIDPTTPSTLYAISDSNVYKSVNSGASWSASSSGITPPSSGYRCLGIDTRTPSTLYVGVFGDVYKSTNGAGSWSKVTNGLPFSTPLSIVVDPADSATVYMLFFDSLYKSTNGGGSWTRLTAGIPAGSNFLTLAVDPKDSSNVYLSAFSGVLKSTNKGASWSLSSNGIPQFSLLRAIEVDPKTNTTVYAGAGSTLFKSTDAGATWASVGTGLPAIGTLTQLVIDPGNPSTIYWLSGSDTLFYSGGSGVYKSTDGGETWRPFNTGLNTLNAASLAIDPKSPSNLYLGTQVSQDAFLAKLNSTGSALLYSTYLGGASDDQSEFLAMDSSGNAYITGSTSSRDFPVVNAFQDHVIGGVDPFVLKMNASGTALAYSTFLGGSSGANAYGIAVNSAGNAFVVGSTGSNDFPVSRDAFQRSKRFGNDAFVVKLAPNGSELSWSTYLGGGGQDYGYAIALDGSGTPYVAGSTSSSDFPVLTPFQPASRGKTEGFVARLIEGSPPSSDLSITKTATPSPATAGQNVTYTLTIRNAGPSDNTGVKITDTLPSGVTFVSASASVGSCSQASGTVTCTIGALANGASATATLVVTPAAAGSISNTAAVSGDVDDVDTANNSTTVETTVGSAARADLAITKTGSPDPARAGSSLTYTIRVTNNGPSPASAVEVSDDLPPGASFGSIASTQGSCRTAFSGARLCDIGALANGASATVTLVVTPLSAGSLSNTATVTAVETDPVTANNSATATLTVAAPQQPGADLAVTKSASPSPATAGSNLSYSLAVTNRGPATATSVRVTDALPSGLSFVSASSSQGTCSQSSGTVTCNLGTLASGASATATLVALPASAGTVTNVASVSAAEPDENTGNNSASVQTTVATAPPTASRLYFAHFGNGAVSGAQLFSQILLFNLDATQPVSARIVIRDDQGNPFSVVLNGEAVNGEKQVNVAAGGLQVLRSDGQGPLRAGSVTVTSDRALTGVIVFGGTIGLDGVGSSPALAEGFVAPVESNSAQGINTAIAMMSLEEQRSVTADLQLTDTEGRLLATARLDGARSLPPNGHAALFVDELAWSPRVDFSSFSGVLKVGTSGRIAATILQTRPAEFATMPVTSRTGLAKDSPDAAALQPSASSDGSLYFAHLVSGTAGATQIASQILLLNLSPSRTLNARLTLRDDAGRPLLLTLNGESVNGQKDLAIPPAGLRVLRTSAQSAISTGSASVTGDGPVAGVVVFGGNIGVAGVPAGDVLEGGFTAPVESSRASGISTGIAMMNLETREVSADLALLNSSGTTLATARVAGADILKAEGHLARFIEEFNWTPRVDLSSFSGLLKVTPSGRIAATVLQVRPAQFATMPVAALAATSNPVPVLNSLSPASAVAGGSAFTLTVTGANFVNSSVVRWNGAARTTNYVSSTQLTASISAADIASAGTAAVTVVNPSPGGGTSSPATFTISQPVSGNAPSITNLEVTRTMSIFGRDTLEVDISLRDGDGDMTRIDLKWFSGTVLQASSVKPGAGELSLAGLTIGTRTFLFNSDDLGVSVSSIDGVEVEVTDAKGNRSAKVRKTF